MSLQNNILFLEKNILLFLHYTLIIVSLYYIIRNLIKFNIIGIILTIALLFGGEGIIYFYVKYCSAGQHVKKKQAQREEIKKLIEEHNID